MRGKRVLAKADAAGDLEVVEGKVEICYAEGGKIYRAWERNLSEAGQSSDEPRTEAKTPGAVEVRATPATPPVRPSPGEALAYTDGACSGNPGPAGIGVVLITENDVRELSEFLGSATNNVAELAAIGRAAEECDAALPLSVFTDSSYAIGVLSGRMRAKKNKALIENVRQALAVHPRVELHHVSAHVGIPLNERADELAVQAVKSRQSSGWVDLSKSLAASDSVTNR